MLINLINDYELKYDVHFGWEILWFTSSIFGEISLIYELHFDEKFVHFSYDKSFYF